MKNVIPVITAVILGLAAVFAVSRIMSKSATPPERTVTVVAASQNIRKDEVIDEKNIFGRPVAVSALPNQYIAWRDRAILFGQKVNADIARGDYVLHSNIGVTNNLGDMISKGEWGVPVTFADTTLLPLLNPADEIAIVGIYSIKVPVKASKDRNEAPQYVEQKVSTVIYPKVRILQKIGNNAIILSMQPTQAIALLNIQQYCQLFPVLRKNQDSSNLAIKDGGIFTAQQVFGELVKDVPPISIPTSAKPDTPQEER